MNPFRDDNEALRAQNQNLIAENNRITQKNNKLSKKISRVRVNDGAIVIFMIVFTIGGFFGGLHARMPMSCNSVNIQMSTNNHEPQRQPHPGNFSPSDLLEEKDFYQKLLKIDREAAIIWEKAVPHAQLYESASCNDGCLQPIEWRSRDEWGATHVLKVGEKNIHPYGSYKLGPSLIFQIFPASHPGGIQMKLDIQTGTWFYEVLDTSSLAYRWKRLPHETHIRNNEIIFWRGIISNYKR